jgi:hypothetical protein
MYLLETNSVTHGFSGTSATDIDGLRGAADLTPFDQSHPADVGSQYVVR